MSAGDFTRAFYEGDDGTVYPIRIQPETLAAQFDDTANASASGPATVNLFARINKNRGEYGVGARSVTAEWTAAQPTGYSAGGRIKIAVPDKTIFDGITLLSTGTYLGAGITIIGKNSENIR